MARPGVTREQVFEAAEALLTEGQNPTIVAVRTRLGGGSPNTITPLLAEWRAQRETHRAESLPPLPETVEAAMRQVWGAAWKATQTQLAAEREALGAVRKEVERERGEMLGEIARLDGELEAAREALQQVRADLETERRAHGQTQALAREAQVLAEERGKRVGAQEVELKALRGHAAEAATRAGRLETDLEQARTELNRERETARQAKAALDAGAGKIRKLEEGLEAERAARHAAETALAALRIEVATLTERAAHLEELRALIGRLRPGGPT